MQNVIRIVDNTVFMSLAVYRLRSNYIVAITLPHDFPYDERRILRRVTAIAASHMHACTDSCALADPKRATRADVGATGGLSRAVMDVGRLKFCEIPGLSLLPSLFPACSSLSPFLHIVPSLISQVENARH